MPLQGVEFQAILFLIVCRNAVPDADLKIKVGGRGGAPLDSPLEVLGFSSRIGYYIHWNLSNGMKIRVSIFFPYLQLAAKLLKPCPLKGYMKLGRTKQSTSVSSPHPFQVWVFVVVFR